MTPISSSLPSSNSSASSSHRQRQHPSFSTIPAVSDGHSSSRSPLPDQLQWNGYAHSGHISQYAHHQQQSEHSQRVLGYEHSHPAYPSYESQDPYHSYPFHPSHPFPANYNPNPHAAAYLPPVSSSPPPKVPQYVPPPQHQLPPDPIHSRAPGYIRKQVNDVEYGDGFGWGWQPPPQLDHPLQYQAHPDVLPSSPIHRPSSTSDGISGAAGVSGMDDGSQLIRGAASTYLGGVSARPGSAADGSGAIGHGGFSGRERRRRDRDFDRDGAEDEVITTIFVVGFPDDMLEREFQNIFTFAQGFEAATLKYPSSSSRGREPAAALIAELTHLAAFRESSRTRELSEDQEQQLALQQQGLEEALAALHLNSSMGGTASTSQSTTPSGATSLTPAVASGPTLGGQMVPPARRQTIGFARFKTKQDALSAREQLQGRKIDHLTGSTFKAEMAKKNLHLKRATSGDELVGMILRSGRLAGNLGTPTAPAGYSARERGESRDWRDENQYGGRSDAGFTSSSYPNQGMPSAKEAWDSWPLSSSANSDHQDTIESSTTQQSIHSHPSTYHDPDPNTTTHRHHTYDNPISASYPQQQVPYTSNHAPVTPSTPFYPVSSRSSIDTSSSQSLSTKSSLQLQRHSISGPISSGHTDSKALLALAEEADELEMEMELGSMAAGSQDDTPKKLERDYSGFSYPLPKSHSQGLGSGSGEGGREIKRSEILPTSPTATSEALSDAGRSVGGNPADMNPPINTLYIGNLPAVSPPTHPPSFLEESLRGLFSRMAGYKRMSFRQKINGPMCFVEFEDVGFATLAIKEAYGHNLNGLVKGGIRLSYSKNSLGQRGQTHTPGPNNSIFGSISQTVALAGISTSPSSSGSPSSNNNYIGSPPQSFSSLGLSHTNANPHRDTTTLSPTAQPFTIPSLSSSSSASAQATSPRSRYFAPTSTSGSETRSPGFSSHALGSGQSAATSIPNSGGGSGGSVIGSPASPLRSPAGFSSWVSTGSVGTGYGGQGFPSSFGGVASTWGSHTTG